MTTATRPLLLLALVAALNAGCGGGSGNGAATTTSTDAKTTSTQASAATLKAAVRTTIHANVALSLYVLWHNRIPSWATRSTRGPALKALRSAAATRRKQGIQIKNLSGHYTILSIALAPSYTGATVVVRDTRTVAPFKAGRRLGKAIKGTDHSHVELHRLANTQRFVVWRVSPVQ
ncbi:MAG: hypothetical protein H0X39_04835 [Actinobacteria bacterium]|nr:hypothetical protein [Actinomycetota bacterium]